MAHFEALEDENIDPLPKGESKYINSGKYWIRDTSCFLNSYFMKFLLLLNKLD